MLVCVFVAAFLAAVCSDDWRIKSPMLFPRSDHSLVMVDEPRGLPARLLVSGGCVADTVCPERGTECFCAKCSASQEQYDFLTDTWTLAAEMPNARCGHSAQHWTGYPQDQPKGEARRLQSNLVFVGGRTQQWDASTGTVSSSFVASVDLWSISDNRWNSIPAGHIQLVSPATAIFGSQLFVVGGFSGPGLDPVAAVHQLDLTTLQWKTDDSAHKRAAYSAAMLNGVPRGAPCFAAWPPAHLQTPSAPGRGWLIGGKTDSLGYCAIVHDDNQQLHSQASSGDRAHQGPPPVLELLANNGTWSSTRFSALPSSLSAAEPSTGNGPCATVFGVVVMVGASVPVHPDTNPCWLAQGTPEVWALGLADGTSASWHSLPSLSQTTSVGAGQIVMDKQEQRQRHATPPQALGLAAAGVESVGLHADGVWVTGGRGPLLSVSEAEAARRLHGGGSGTTTNGTSSVGAPSLSAQPAPTPVPLPEDGAGVYFVSNAVMWLPVNRFGGTVKFASNGVHSSSSAGGSGAWSLVTLLIVGPIVVLVACTIVCFTFKYRKIYIKS